MSAAGLLSADDCRMCEGDDLQQVMALTPTPPGNNFLAADELSQGRNRPTRSICTSAGPAITCSSGTSSIRAILYQNYYTYVSATSSKFVEHLRQYAAEMVDRFALKPGSLVADIGSNDGTCLRFFTGAGMSVAGRGSRHRDRGAARRRRASRRLASSFPTTWPSACASNTARPHSSRRTTRARTSTSSTTCFAACGTGWRTTACSCWRSAICSTCTERLVRHDLPRASRLPHGRAVPGAARARRDGARWPSSA